MMTTPQPGHRTAIAAPTEGQAIAAAARRCRELADRAVAQPFHRREDRRAGQGHIRRHGGVGRVRGPCEAGARGAIPRGRQQRGSARLFESGVDERGAAGRREGQPVGLREQPHVVPRRRPVRQVRGQRPRAAVHRNFPIALDAGRAREAAGQQEPHPLGQRSGDHERDVTPGAEPRDGRSPRQRIHRLERRRRAVELDGALPGRRGHPRHQHHRCAGAVSVRGHSGGGDADGPQRVDVRVEHRKAGAVRIGDVGIAEAERRLRPGRAGCAQPLRIEVSTAALDELGDDEWIAAFDQPVDASAPREKVDKVEVC